MHNASRQTGGTMSRAQHLAHCATAKEIHDGQQNDCSEQRHQERWQAKVVLVNGANTKERRQQEPGQQSADHSNNNIEEYPLLRVCTHDEAGDPSEDAANDEPQNKIHTLPPFLLCETCIFPCLTSPPRLRISPVQHV